MPAAFKDHFSEQSSDYARYRPHYPRALFEYLASLTDSHDCALDVATGNGQAAVALTDFFANVVAIDASKGQIEAAIPDANVSYKVATAESSGLPAASVDLVSVAQAFHWFDADAFFVEARRVLRSEGVLAMWLYEITRINADCDVVVDRLYRDILGLFWPQERQMIDDGYAHVELPGSIIEAQPMAMTERWRVDDMLGYLRTWSASKRYQKHHGSDPVMAIEPDLRSAWGSDPRVVSWPLVLKLCRPHKPARIASS